MKRDIKLMTHWCNPLLFLHPLGNWQSLRTKERTHGWSEINKKKQTNCIFLYIFNPHCMNGFISSHFKSNSPFPCMASRWPLAPLCEQTFLSVSSQVPPKFMVSVVAMTSFLAVNLKFSTGALREPWQRQQLLYEMNVFSPRVPWASAHWRLITPRGPIGGIQKYKYPCDAMASARRRLVFENASLAERLPVIVSLNRQPRGLWPLPRQVRQPEPPCLRDLSRILANTHLVGNCGEWAGLKIASCQIKKGGKKNPTRLLQAARVPWRCLWESLWRRLRERILAIRNVWWDREQRLGTLTFTSESQPPRFN